MGLIQNDISPGYCLDDVQCEDLLTAVNINKWISSIRSLQGIGTHGVDLPELYINDVHRPAHGWSSGMVTLPLGGGPYAPPPIYVAPALAHCCPFFADYNRFTLTFEARLIEKIDAGIAPNFRRVRSSVQVYCIGYNGAFQVLADVTQAGFAAGPNQYMQAPNGAGVTREIVGTWNANMLPPSGGQWQGFLVINHTIWLTNAGGGTLYYNNASLNLNGHDYYGVRRLQLRHHKFCS